MICHDWEQYWSTLCHHCKSCPAATQAFHCLSNERRVLAMPYSRHILLLATAATLLLLPCIAEQHRTYQGGSEQGIHVLTGALWVQAMLGNRHNMFCQALVAWAHLGEPARVAELLQNMAGMGLTTGAKLHKSVIQGLVSAGKHEVRAPRNFGIVRYADQARADSGAKLYWYFNTGPGWCRMSSRHK